MLPPESRRSEYSFALPPRQLMTPNRKLQMPLSLSRATLCCDGVLLDVPGRGDLLFSGNHRLDSVLRIDSKLKCAPVGVITASTDYFKLLSAIC